MSRVEETLRRAIAELRRLNADFALVGGLAVSVRTEPRFTRDVDCAVAVMDDRETEALVAGLLASGWRPSAQIEQESARRLATMRLVPAGEPGAVVDLLFASSGIEREVVRAADEVVVAPDLRCRVARIGHLVALKLLARDDRERPQDRGDLVALLRAASPNDLEQARSACELIAQRGFARGKDLVADLAKARAELR